MKYFASAKYAASNSRRLRKWPLVTKHTLCISSGEISRSLLTLEGNVVPDAVNALRGRVSVMVSQVIATYGDNVDAQTLYGYVIEKLRTVIRSSHIPKVSKNLDNL